MQRNEIAFPFQLPLLTCSTWASLSSLHKQKSETTDLSFYRINVVFANTDTETRLYFDASRNSLSFLHCQPCFPFYTRLQRMVKIPIPTTPSRLVNALLKPVAAAPDLGQHALRGSTRHSSQKLSRIIKGA
jgi:hypothetical protein